MNGSELFHSVVDSGRRLMADETQEYVWKYLQSRLGDDVPGARYPTSYRGEIRLPLEDDLDPDIYQDVAEDHGYTVDRTDVYRDGHEEVRIDPDALDEQNRLEDRIADMEKTASILHLSDTVVDGITAGSGTVRTDQRYYLGGSNLTNFPNDSLRLITDYLERKQ